MQKLWNLFRSLSQTVTQSEITAKRYIVKFVEDCKSFNELLAWICREEYFQTRENWVRLKLSVKYNNGSKMDYASELSRCLLHDVSLQCFQLQIEKWQTFQFENQPTNNQTYFFFFLIIKLKFQKWIDKKQDRRKPRRFFIERFNTKICLESLILNDYCDANSKCKIFLRPSLQESQQENLS